MEFLNNNDVDVARPDRISGADINAIIQEVKFTLKLPTKCRVFVSNIILHYSTQNPANIRSKSTIEAQEKGMKYVQN